MGLHSSAHICQRVTNAFSFIFLNIGLGVLNNLEDFGGVERKDCTFCLSNNKKYFYFWFPLWLFLELDSL